jgi:hypothetical protein
VCLFFVRRHDGLFGQRVLLPLHLHRPHHVPVEQRSRRGAPAEAATVGDGVLLPARQVPDRGELGAVLLPHGRIHGEVSGRRWRSVSSDVLELTSRKSSHADRSNAAHRKSALHVESEVGGHSLAAYARAPHTPSGAPSLPSDTPSARGPRGAPGPHLCLVLSESLCASPRLRSPSLSLRLRTNRVRDSARFLCTPPPRPSLISF